MKDIPTKNEILDWVRDNPGRASKRDIARAFNIKGAGRIELKRMIREMRDEGVLKKGGRKTFRGDGALPPVGMLSVIGTGDGGDLFAKPESWEDETPPPRIIVVEKKGDPALTRGDRLLARLIASQTEDGLYEARMIRKIAGGARRALGIYRAEDGEGRLVPIDRKQDEMILVDSDDARDGELVEVETLPGPRFGLRRAKVVERLGDPGAARSVSLIAVHAHGIPTEFPEAALREAEAAKPVRGLKGREDLRHLPLITIDPADARDHDDAVCAEPDPDREDGWVVWVAIADVAHYVRPGSALDREARKRGNSTYFPDRVVPMLPDSLSGDLCSLHEGADRPCIAARMVLGPDGGMRGHSFHRGLMRSPAALTYERVQAAMDGAPDEGIAPLVESVLKPLYGAFKAAWLARERRAPLHLELPERRIELSETGEVTAVRVRERLAAHKLIEEFMILANVAAAETLEKKRRPFLYRAHEEPNPLKLDALRTLAEEAGYRLAKGQVLQTRHLNALLDAAAGTPDAELINLSVLRSQTQAYYAPENFGHFGLSLRSYAHFTSPIRRYADLIVHRALIAAHGWGDDGQTMEEAADLGGIAEHISMTERRSMDAERDTVDRYLSAYLADRIGAEFDGRVSGVARFGLFVKLDESGADGLVPISSLGAEYFRYDEARAALVGEKTGKTITMGARARVRLAEAAPLTGGLLFELLDAEGFGKPARAASRGGAPKRRLGQARAKRAKLAKKTRRR
ncbi:ribonuclease R [Pikeienuella piscinae]|uniref:Ribonuclease R n=1 Tax=Pikeienuella piscinae TaxID=2748098 RepID=A0A7L5BVN8_9RHOB|nr:ribonuclease R [Pikeienuella piscinae]QIE54266.1 ribonuclease R [Pikeienuella piscinae]